MRLHRVITAGALLVLAGAGTAALLLRAPDVPARNFDGITGDVERGAYLARLAGCIACHTDTAGGREFLAGGAPIKTPFGAFRAPNITPHVEDGIGGWTLAEFSAALTRGTSPEGSPYYPVFPYAAYTEMTNQDIADLWAAMKTVPPAEGGRADHEIGFPFNVRFALRAWQNLFLDPGPFKADPDRDELWNRGAYIVTGPGHCVACHTPRNLLGARERSRHLNGSKGGPGGEKVPAIVGSALGSEGWGKRDVIWALRMGLKPDGDSLSGSMGEVVRHSTSWLSEDDLKAIAHYLMSVE